MLSDSSIKSVCRCKGLLTMGTLKLHSISRKGWCYCALLLPLFLPALWWVVLQFFPLLARAGLFFNIINAVFFYLTFAALYGGVQYLAFVAGLIWWSRNKTTDEFLRSIWVWPILFVPICGLGWVLVKIFSGDFNFEMLLGSIALGIVAIPFGYFYICLAIAITRLFQRTGWVEN